MASLPQEEMPMERVVICLSFTKVSFIGNAPRKTQRQTGVQSAKFST